MKKLIFYLIDIEFVDFLEMQWYNINIKFKHGFIRKILLTVIFNTVFTLYSILYHIIYFYNAVNRKYQILY